MQRRRISELFKILRDPDLSADVRAQVEVIQRKAKEMSALISQLLLLSRADQGRQVLQKERLDISELTEMVVEEQQMLAQEKRITVTARIEPDTGETVSKNE